MQIKISEFFEEGLIYLANQSLPSKSEMYNKYKSGLKALANVILPFMSLTVFKKVIKQLKTWDKLSDPYIFYSIYIVQFILYLSKFEQ